MGGRPLPVGRAGDRLRVANVLAERESETRCARQGRRVGEDDRGRLGNLDHQAPRANGGELRVFDPWLLVEAQLVATQLSYRLSAP